MDSNWAGKNYYDILGASQKDSISVLKKKYRDLARKHHPDKSGASSSDDELFKKISEAYSVLSDPVKRADYDEFLLYENNYSSVKENMYSSQNSFKENYYSGRNDIFNFFDTMFSSGSEESFATVFDIESEISIDLASALNGTVVDLNLNIPLPCSCNSFQGSSCTKCHGLGSVKSVQKIKTRIPPGIIDKTVLRIPNKGTSNGKKGSRGDLFLTINILPHPFFKREGNDLHVTVPITYTEAVFGANITIPLLTNDEITFKIPALTNTSKLLKIKGKGVRKDLESSGDLIVKLEVSVPDTVSSSERKLLEKYAKLNQFNPRNAMFVGGV